MKLQSHDSKGQPCYIDPTPYANTGRKAPMLALGLEPKSISPNANPAFKEDTDAEGEGITVPSEAPAIQIARHQTQVI